MSSKNDASSVPDPDSALHYPWCDVETCYAALDIDATTIAHLGPHRHKYECPTEFVTDGPTQYSSRLFEYDNGRGEVRMSVIIECGSEEFDVNLEELQRLQDLLEFARVDLEAAVNGRHPGYCDCPGCLRLGAE